MLAAQKELLENEISTQRESLKLQFANVPSQMNELAKSNGETESNNTHSATKD